MTLLEYVQSLQDQGLSQPEIFEKVQEFKKNNPQKENVEEVKEDVEVKQDDSQTQDPSSESSDNTGSESETGSSQQSSFSFSSTPGLSNKQGGFGTDAFATNLSNKMRQEEQQKAYEKYTAVAKPNETITKNGFDFKYDENGIYYYKPEGEGDDKWKTYKDKNGRGNLGIASQFGHSDFDSSESYKTQKLLKEGQEVYNGVDGQLIITEGKQLTLSPEMLELEKQFIKDTAITDKQKEKVQKDTDSWFATKEIPVKKIVNRSYKAGGGPVEVETGEMKPNPEWEEAQIKSKKAWDKLDPKPKNISEQQWIENNMKENHAAELLDEQKKENLETWIEDQGSRFDWKAAAMMLNNFTGSAFSMKDVFDKSDKQKMVEAIQQTRKLNLDRKQKAADDFATKAKTTIEGLNRQITALSEAKYQTKDEAIKGKALITKLVEKRDEVFNIYEEKVDGLNEMMLKPEYKNIDTRLDYLERNFNPLVIYSENVKMAGVNAGKSILDLGHMIANIPNEIGISDNPITSKVFNVFSPGASLVAKFVKSSPYLAARADLNEMVDGYIEQTSKGIAHAQTLSDLKDGSDWGRYFSTMLGSQTINTGVMFLGGPIALPALVAQSAGMSYREIEKENEERQKLGLPTYTPFQMYTTVAGNAGLEYFSERISLGIISRSKAAFNAMGPSVRQGFGQQIGSLFTKQGATRAAGEAGFYVADTLKEGGSEGLVEFGSNWFDRYVLGKSDVNLFDGVADATFSGLTMSGVVYKAPGIGASIVNMVKGPDSATKIANNYQKVLDLQETINSNPNMSEANLARLNDQILDLTRSSSNEINKTINRFGRMDRSTIDDLSNIELKVHNKKKAIDEVKSDPNFNNKEAEINRIENEILELQIEKNNILEPYIKEDAKQSKKGLSKEETVELTGRVQEGSDVVAEQLGDVGITRFDTTEDIIGAFETLKEQGIQLDVATNEAGEILDAKDQGYGLIATLPDGTQQVIINNASSEADGVLPADKHEILHAFAAKMDPAKLAQMGKDLKAKLDSDPNVKVDAETQSLLKEYEADLNAGKINEATFYEEVMAVTSDALTSGGITITEPGKFKTFLNNFLDY